MAQQADIVLADGQATPVNHTFSKRGATMQLAKWLDVSSGVPIGYPVITMGNAMSGRSGSGSWRTELRVVVPTLEVISGSDGGYTPQPKVAYNLFGKVELVAPDRSTLQMRKDLFAYVKNLLANAQVSDAFQTMDIPT